MNKRSTIWATRLNIRAVIYLVKFSPSIFHQGSVCLMVMGTADSIRKNVIWLLVTLNCWRKWDRPSFLGRTLQWWGSSANDDELLKQLMMECFSHTSFIISLVLLLSNSNSGTETYLAEISNIETHEATSPHAHRSKRSIVPSPNSSPFESSSAATIPTL